MLVDERAVTPLELVTIDVDHDPELQRRYGVRVPVVAVDGVELFELEVPHDLLRARLRGRHQGVSDGHPSV